MNENRLVDLETKLAYQEETVRVLNEMVATQQKRLEQLEATCRRLAQRIAAAADGTSASTADDVRPFNQG